MVHRGIRKQQLTDDRIFTKYGRLQTSSPRSPYRPWPRTHRLTQMRGWSRTCQHPQARQGSVPHLEGHLPLHVVLQRRGMPLQRSQLHKPLLHRFAHVPVVLAQLQAQQAARAEHESMVSG